MCRHGYVLYRTVRLGDIIMPDLFIYLGLPPDKCTLVDQEALCHYSHIKYSYYINNPVLH